MESFRELTVVILPPWWASWWAYVIYMIIAVALLLVAIKLSLFMIKVKNDVYIEQKLSELKIKFFTNISHELRTPLTLIQGPIQELKEKEKLSQERNAIRGSDRKRIPNRCCNWSIRYWIYRKIQERKNDVCMCRCST